MLNEFLLRQICVPSAATRMSLTVSPIVQTRAYASPDVVHQTSFMTGPVDVDVGMPPLRDKSPNETTNNSYIYLPIITTDYKDLKD